MESEYIPGDDNLLEIDVREIVKSQLTYQFNMADTAYLQTGIWADFTATIGDTDYPFRVVCAGVADLADTATNWLRLHFLTWQPRVKQVTYYSPEWLTYYAVEECSVKLKATYPDKSVKTITLGTCIAGHATTMNMQYAVVAGKLGNTYPSYYEVWTEKAGGTKLSESQFYAFSDPLSEDEQWFLFENSLGGLDTFRASGTNNLAAEHEHNIAEFSGIREEYEVDTNRKYVKNTGFLDEYSRRWLLDFFPSHGKYIYEATAIRKIVVTDSTATYISNELPSSYTFTWQFAEISAFLNLVKNENDIPDNLVAPDLSSPDFILPPRLAEFTRVQLTEGVLIPAFDPFNSKPTVTSYGAIHNSIKNAIVKELEDEIGNIGTGPGGGGTISGDIDILQGEGILIEKKEEGGIKCTISHGDTSKGESSANEGTFIIKNILVDKFGHVTGVESTDLSITFDGKYIRKDKPDETDYRVDFHDGLTTGHYVGGLLGDGSKIDRDGHAEMTSLTLREFLEVPELRFNRIDVVSGELWNAIAFGLIESVDEANRIIKLKLEEGELSGLHLSDFCRGIFHNLRDNETAPGIDSCGFEVMVGFRTSYFTPVEILDNARFRYELKPGSTVHPCASMKFAVYGNPIDKNRQASAYHTRTYTRYLRGVNTWKIEAKHISMQLGDLSNLIVNGESLSAGSVYLNNVYFGGNIWSVSGEENGLKGHDAYSVTLSTYCAVYNVADGIKSEADVVINDKLLVTGANQVVASLFNISTRLQVTKGDKTLRFSNTIGEGKYIVSSVGTGCSYVITDGLVMVRDVTEEKAEIKLEVNCEGVAIYEVVFTILRVKDGKDGKDYEYIFTRTASFEAPAIPESLSVDDYVPSGWTDDSAGPTLALPFEWVSKRIKKNGNWGRYSQPSVWARYGEDGTDYEYIYIRTGMNIEPSLPETNQSDDYIPSGWTDDPVGPTREFPFEWVSSRRKEKGIWSSFSQPALWSRFAEDGKETEFIYFRTEVNRQPSTPLTFQVDDYVPDGWTDDPMGVTSFYLYEWVSKREKKKGVWGNFSVPVIWAKYGESGGNGVDGKTTYQVYKRSESQPSIPGGTTVPPPGWSLDPSSGSVPLWMSKGIFNGDGSLYSTWSYPIRISGDTGSTGASGPSITYRGLYSSSKQYSGTPVRVDVVKEGSYWYIAKTTAGIFIGQYPGVDTAYWTRLQGQFESFATGLLIADQANISGWRYRDNYIESQNNNVVFDGNADDGPRIALGSSYTNRNTAPTRLYDDGRIDTQKLIARDGCEIGNFRVTTGKLSNKPDTFAMMQMTYGKAEISLGTDLVPTVAGGAFTLLGRISNKISNGDAYFKTENIGLELSAENASINTALSCPNGDVRINKGSLIINERPCTSNVSDAIVLNIKTTRRFVFQPAYYLSVYLPSREQIESMIGLWDAGFASGIEINILLTRWASQGVNIQGVAGGILVDGNGGIPKDNNSISGNYGNINLTKCDSCTLYYFNETWYITHLNR